MDKLLFIHGLNNNNKIWEDLILEYQDRFEIHQVNLLGHTDDFDKLHTLKPDELVLDLAKSINKIKGPKHIIAYSLGALTLSRALEQNLVDGINKVIYLAPAFKVKFLKTLKVVTKISPVRELKSVAPLEYARHAKLPINIYKTLIDLGAEVDLSKVSKDALVLCSSKDLLVDYGYIKKICVQKSWELIDLKRKKTHQHPAFQHMIFNKEYLGVKWELVVTKISSYLA